MFTFNELAGRQPAGVKKTSGTISGRFAIRKADEDKHLAFGWAYVSQDEAGQQTEDHSGDQLEPEELETAAYQFVELYREGGEMHERGGCAVLVESMTHWDADSDEACKIYAAVVHCIIDAAADGIDDPDAMHLGILNTMLGTRYDTEDIVAEGDRGELKPTGYVVDSLKCALYALWKGQDFKEAVANAANMGGDADTIAAICGGLAGAIYGYKAIPEYWAAQLPRDDVERIEAAVKAAVKNWRSRYGK